MRFVVDHTFSRSQLRTPEASLEALQTSCFGRAGICEGSGKYPIADNWIPSGAYAIDAHEDPDADEAQSTVNHSPSDGGGSIGGRWWISPLSAEDRTLQQYASSAAVALEALRRGRLPESALDLWDFVRFRCIAPTLAKAAGNDDFNDLRVPTLCLPLTAGTKVIGTLCVHLYSDICSGLEHKQRESSRDFQIAAEALSAALAGALAEAEAQPAKDLVGNCLLSAYTLHDELTAEWEPLLVLNCNTIRYEQRSSGRRSRGCKALTRSWSWPHGPPIHVPAYRPRRLQFYPPESLLEGLTSLSPLAEDNVSPGSDARPDRRKLSPKPSLYARHRTPVPNRR